MKWVVPILGLSLPVPTQVGVVMVLLPMGFALVGPEDVGFVMEITSMHRLVVPIEAMMIGLMLDGSNATQEVIYIVLNNNTQDT